MPSKEWTFTLQEYVSLLETAKARFRFAMYTDIPRTDPFVLWRHDVDYSLNRARLCAEEEARLEALATYFVNPTSSFYNPFEASQAQLVRDIEAMGHRIGLHFDANNVDPKNIEVEIMAQRRAVEEILGVVVEAVSFHNPKAEHLALDADSYGGGLVNAYSKTLMQNVTYSSDSNGYWRHRPLLEVLQDESVTRLQVLTHPGWWQNVEMPPRSRIWRSVYGRASNVMRDYDELLRNDGRANLSGGLCVAFRGTDLQHRADQGHQDVIDFLWHAEAFAPLYVVLEEVLASMEASQSATSPIENRADDGSLEASATGVSMPSVERSNGVTGMTNDELRSACVEFMARIAALQGQLNDDETEVATTTQTDS